MGLVEATAILMRMMGKAGVTVDEVRALRVGVGRILKRRVDNCKAWARKHAGEPLGGAVVVPACGSGSVLGAVAREFAGLGSGGAEVLEGGTGEARTGAGLQDGDAAEKVEVCDA